MPILSNSLIGVEDLLDDIEAVIIENINPSLELVYTAREAKDIARAARRGKPYIALGYDEVPQGNFHTGTVPSFVKQDVPIEAYPYIALTWEDYAIDAEDAIQDMRTVVREAVSLHHLAIATDDEGAEIAFRRAVRMAEASFLAMASNPKMQRMLSGLSNPVRSQPSIPFTAKAKGRGSNFWFVAVGTSYQIKSYSSQYD